MVSLKRYLNRGADDPVLAQVVTLLFEKIGAEAVVADDKECAAFQADVAKLRDCITQQSTPETILLSAGSLTQAMESYNRGITRFIRKQGAELQSIVRMMTETIATISGENTRSTQKLREIGDGMEKASGLQDIAMLKSHLGECLQAFRQETLRQKEQAESVIVALRAEIDRNPAPPGAARTPSNADPATGLKDRDLCLKTMASPVPAGKRRYVVTLVVNRFQAINARFGRAAGDRVLRAFGEYVKQQISPTEMLFHWSGPSVVAVIERTESLEQIRVQFKRMLDTALQETFEVEGRGVLIPISAAWQAFHFITTVATAEKQIETFIASQGSREYI